jgi:pimeloyl-ACP methyl ester carboxylesterase
MRRRLAPLFLVYLLAACGSSAGSTPEPASPSNGTQTEGRVDVGGYELDWVCRGNGSPTIVLETGYDSAGIDTWSDLLGSISGISRVCTYDRAGTGGSDRRPEGLRVTGVLEAEELHRLLDGAGHRT